ncbi:hypothetical protein D3C75_1341880 [compost metagenome]
MIKPTADQPFLRFRGRQQLLMIEVDHLIEQRLTVVIQIRQFGAQCHINHGRDS